MGEPIASWDDLRERLLAEIETSEASDKRALPLFGPYRAAGRQKHGPAPEAVTSLWIDLDRLTQAELDRLLDQVKASGVEAIVYTTPSDEGAGTEPRKVRVVMRLDRELRLEECGPLRSEVAKTLGVVTDRATLDPKRGFFAGRISGTPAREVWVFEGRTVPVDVFVPPKSDVRAAPTLSLPPIADGVSTAWIPAAAAALAPHYTLGIRNALALAIGGACSRRGIPPEVCAAFVAELPSENPEARVSDALRSYDAPNPRGWAELRELLPPEAFSAFDRTLPNPALEALAAQTRMGQSMPKAAASPAAANDTHAGASALRNEANQDPRTNDAITVLGSYRDVYQRGQVLVHVTRSPRRDASGVVRPVGTPTINTLQQTRLEEILESRRQSKAYARIILARKEWAFIQPLESIVRYPVLRPDGSVLAVSGYDEPTAVMADIDLVVTVGEARNDATRALAVLFELMGDFPFASEADRAAWLGGLLTPLARPALTGPAPLFLLEANARGAGKGLLADVIGAICTGADLPRRVAPKTQEEWDKALFAIALAGDPIVLLDNVTEMLRSSALDAILTATEYGGRVLGVSEERKVPLRTTWIVTANNARLSTDLVRRSLRCRLESETENPEQRTGFKHPDLLAHVREQRGVYLGAALTILRAYAVAGRPSVSARALGSYASWCRIVRDAIVWAGGEDCVTTQDQLREGADVERDDTAALFAAWHGLYGPQGVRADDGVTARAVLERAEAIKGAVANPSDSRAKVLALADAIEGVLPNGMQPSAKAFGAQLSRLKGRHLGTFRFEGTRDRTNVMRWQLHCSGCEICRPRA